MGTPWVDPVIAPVVEGGAPVLALQVFAACPTMVLVKRRSIVFTSPVP